MTLPFSTFSDQGDFRFGHPVRVTATTRLGEGPVVDIERESTLGGAIHTKGVMILSSFLAARYARGPARPAGSWRHAARSEQGD